MNFHQKEIQIPEGMQLEVGTNLENLQANSNLPTTFSVKSNNLL